MDEYKPWTHMQGAEKKVAKSCGKKPVKIGEAQKCV